MNPIHVTELCSIVVLIAFASRQPRNDAVRAAVLALTALAGEASCVHFYGLYFYAPEWHARIFGVPLLVPLIWAAVILSARDALGSRSTPLAMFLLVTTDATVVELIASNAGLWTWTRHELTVIPWIGPVGWGIFAAAVTRFRHPILAFAATHAGLLAAWWALFRWLPATSHGVFFTAAWAAAMIALVLLYRVSMPGRVVALRLLALSVFALVAVLRLDVLHEALRVASPLVAPYLASVVRSANAPRVGR